MPFALGGMPPWRIFNSMPSVYAASMSPACDFKRLKRYEIQGHARALNFSCFHNLPLLTSDRACRWVADSLVVALDRHRVHLWAFCFMPTHVHLLVLPLGEAPDVASFLESLKKSVSRKALGHVRAHAPEFMPRLCDTQPSGRTHHRFWQRGGGYDRNITTPKAAWAMIRYIHANPVADGLVAREHLWPWSSAAYYAGVGDSPVPVDVTHLPGE